MTLRELIDTINDTLIDDRGIILKYVSYMVQKNGLSHQLMWDPNEDKKDLIEKPLDLDMEFVRFIDECYTGDWKVLPNKGAYLSPDQHLESVRDSWRMYWEEITRYLLSEMIGKAFSSKDDLKAFFKSEKLSYNNNLSELENVFQCVKGRGCYIEFVSEWPELVFPELRIFTIGHFLELSAEIRERLKGRDANLYQFILAQRNLEITQKEKMYTYGQSNLQICCGTNIKLELDLTSIQTFMLLKTLGFQIYRNEDDEYEVKCHDIYQLNGIINQTYNPFEVGK